MVKKENITPEIKKIAIEFARVIKGRGIRVEKIILFGSYAKGMAKEWSDIDLCVVSSMFGKDPISELQFLLKQSRNVDNRIEPVPISAEEYKNSFSPLIFEIKKFGREIIFS